MGDTVTVTVTVARKDGASHRVAFDCVATNQHGEIVIDGVAEVIAPTEKISRPRVVLPEIELRLKGHHYQQLIQQTAGLALSCRWRSRPQHQLRRLTILASPPFKTLGR